MCTNMRYIYNKHLNRAVYVPCGKCPACLQQKANYRANRIRNNVSAGTLALFVTLTYKPVAVPYVLREDLLNKTLDVPVYRDSSYRRVRVTGGYDIKEVGKYGRHQINTISLTQDWYASQRDNPALCAPRLNGSSENQIGVPYFCDLQLFEKRLKQNLKRHYEFDKPFSYFQCSELGETTFRPHFHLLIFCPSACLDAFKSAIIESWPFADRDRTANYIEVARDAASYVASYVNKPADFPQIYKMDKFREKHSYSQGFGKMLACFSLAQILEKTDRRDLTYCVKQTKQGVPCITSFVIPKYVINRYFPKFKGYCRLTDDSLAVVLRTPARLRHLGTIEPYSSGEIRQIEVMLRNAYDRYYFECGKSYEDYIIDYVRVWRHHQSTVYKQFLKSCEDENCWHEAYDNLNELFMGRVHSPTLIDCLENQFKDLSQLETNPNRFSSRVKKSFQLEQLFYKKLKTKKVVNLCMAKLGHLT